MPSDTNIIVSLVNNVALLLAMGVLYDVINPKSRQEKWWYPWAFGIIIGALGIALMHNPMKLFPGVNFDTRSVLLCISGLFFGFIPTLIAAVMTATFRIYMGGGGAIMGVSVITSSAAMGCLWKYARRKKNLATIGWIELLGFGLSVHVVMVLLMFTLPNPIDALRHMALPVIIIYPIATTLLGKLFARQLLGNYAYDSLLHNRSMLQHIMNSIPHYIFWKDRNSVFMGCNKALAKAAGIDKPEDIVGKTDFDLAWLPEEAEAYRADDREVMDSNRPKYHIIEQQLKADGNRIWIDTSKIPLADDTGEIYGILGIYEDVTQRKRSQEELQNAKEFAEKLISTANALVIVLDTEGRIIVFNRAAEEITGYTFDELKDRNWFEILVPRNRYPEVWELHKKMISGTDSKNFENPILTKSGEERYIVWQNNQLTEQGRIIGTVSFGIDITKRKQTEEELRKSRSMLSHIFNAVPHHIFWKDRNSVYLGCNDAFAKAAGVSSPENIIGKTDFDLPWLPEEAKSYRSDDNEVMEHNRPKRHIIEQQLQASGKHLWVDTTKLPLADAAGKVYGLMGIYEDITERKEAEDALRQSEERLRLKLDSILSPDVPIEEQDLSNFLDIPALRSMLENFYALTGMVAAIIDLKGNVLLAVGWQDICTKFHRVNPETLTNCIQSDTYLSNNLEPGKFVSYQCKNGLVDIVTPLIIGGKHMGNVYSGQFFYDDETIDESVFEQQAEKYGFDMQEYMAALRKVPRISHQKADMLMEFLMKFSTLVSKLSYGNLKLAKSIYDQKAVSDALRQSEEHFRLLIKKSPMPIAIGDLDDHIEYVNDKFVEDFGYAIDSLPDFETWTKLAFPDENYRREVVRIWMQDRENETLPDMHTPPREFQVFCKDGEVRTVEITNTRIGDKRMSIGVDLTQRKEYENEIKRNESRLKRLVDILQHPSATMQDFLDYALEQAIQLTGSKIGYIYHYDEQKKIFTLSTWSKHVMPECGVANPITCYELDKTGLWGEAVRQRKPIILNDFIAANPLRKGYPKGHVKLEKFMTVPIFKDNIIIGVIGLANKEKDYDQTDILQTSLLMEGVWKVIELRRVETDLRESEEKYHSYIEHSPYGVFVTDENGYFIQINPAACEMTGYDEATLRTMSIRDILTEKSLNDGLEHFRRTCETGEAQGEMSFRTQNGKTRLWSVDAVKLSDTRLLGFCRDITDLRKVEEDYRQLFKVMLEGFALHEIILDKNGKPDNYRFLAVNPAFERITGLKAEDIVGKTVKEVLPSTEDYWIQNYGKVALTGEPAFFENYSTELNKYFEVSTFRPAPNQFACIITDTTERRRIEEQLRQSQKLESIGRLAGGVAHDFNNLLTPILGYTELLMQKGLSDQENAQEDLRQIRKAAELARDLTRQLLAFSRKQILDLKPVDLRDVVTGFEKLLRITLRENIKLQTHLSQKLSMVMADAGLIEQVLMNLAVNAQDVMPAGGIFSIELAEVFIDKTSQEIIPIPADGKYVMMSVSDTGIGMDKQTIEHIFEPFFTTKEKTKGTGLGLAMVFGIIKQHGGNITVYSVPGKGTTFRIYLPVSSSRDYTPKDNDLPAPTPVWGTETILIVEDNDAVREMVRKELVTHGYKVLAAENAEQCLELSKKYDATVHLVISDIIMPGMDGTELCRKLLETRPKLKVLYISGYTHDVIAHHGMIDADFPLLSKPFTMDALAQKVREILGGHHKT